VVRPLRAPQLRLTAEAGDPEDGARVVGAHSGGEGVRQLLSWQAASCAVPDSGKTARQSTSRRRQQLVKASG
jgi:hypothetical protein